MSRPPTEAQLLAGNLGYLMALEANGLERRAAALVDKIGAALARPAAKDPCARATMGLPEAERGRTEFDLRELDRINARLQRGYKAHRGQTADQQREDDLRRRVELEARAETKREAQDLVRGLTESRALAEARGERVTEDRSGVRRILDHDPIASLTWLSSEQDAAANAIRDAYEMRAVDVGAAEYTGMPGGQHDHERFVANRYERAKATLLIGQVATAVLGGAFRSQRGSLIPVRSHARFEKEQVSPVIALTMIRAVCGQGLTLTSQGAGRAYDRNRRALALGLDVAHEVISG